MAKPIQELAKALSNKTVDGLLGAMMVDHSEREELSLLSQSLTSDWMVHRVGRITASHSKRVYTWAKTLLSKPDANANAVVSRILQYTQTPMTKAMEYGISTEIEAKLKFA